MDVQNAVSRLDSSLDLKDTCISTYSVLVPPHAQSTAGKPSTAHKGWQISPPALCTSSSTVVLVGLQCSQCHEAAYCCVIVLARHSLRQASCYYARSCSLHCTLRYCHVHSSGTNRSKRRTHDSTNCDGAGVHPAFRARSV